MSDVAAPKIPLRERINVRLLVFFLIIGTPLIYLTYLFVRTELTGGIRDIGGGYKEVDLKAMSSFAFDQVNGTMDDVPRQWRDLNGQKVVLYGEMWAPNAAGPQINNFDLVYSIAKCCFSGPPQIQHFVQSRPVNGLVGYYSGLVKVRGTLHVNVVPGEGKVASIYQLDVESVEPVM